MRQVLAGGCLFTGERMLAGYAVVIEGERIAAVVPEKEAPGGGRVRRLPDGALLVPGFIDVQVNGAGGVLFNDEPTADAALAIAAAVRRSGTTGVLPTLLTDEPRKMKQACAAGASALARPGSGVLGVHLEGPFISHERPGVHAREWIRPPDADDVALLSGAARDLGERGRLLVTLAPECVDDAVIAQLSGAGVLVAAGHTAASVERSRQALAAGVRGFTHLFNAMPPMANRAPGPVLAALTDASAWCGVIADGIHVHPALLAMLVQFKPRGRVLLVTDSMPPSGTAATSFQLYGRTILRAGGRLTTEDGTLAGADIDMAAAVQNCVRLLDLPLGEGLRMASLYPAQYLGLDSWLGRIAPSYRADLVLLDPEGGVLATWVAGQQEWYAAESPAA
jgi:N-acetylglucosamine-6-phosphate deacetylase